MQNALLEQQRALVVVDLPFGSYQGNSKKALDSAIRIMKNLKPMLLKWKAVKKFLNQLKEL